MPSIKSSQKHTDKGSSDSSALSFDLVSNLTYMACLAAGNTPRDIVFRATIRQRFKTTVFFRQVFFLAKRLGFDYAHSFRLVAQRASASSVKNTLLRFASALGSGESEQEFLLAEARMEKEKFVGEYQRKIESLQKWGDAYAAFLVSAALIVVVVLISTMLWDFNPGFLYILVFTTFGLTSFGVYIIKVSSPYEVVFYSSGKGPVERRMAMRLLIILGPVGTALGVYVGARYGMGPGMLVFATCLMPAGFFAYKDDARINAVDQHVANFVRALGTVAASLGSTLTIALGKIDRNSLGPLSPFLKRLQARLESQIRPEICWERFRDEVGSELVNRTSRMFVDAASLVGSPDNIGAIATEYSMSIAMLRAQRQSKTLPFAMMVIPLHGAMTGLLIFILEIMKSFNTRLLAAIKQMLESGGEGQVIQMPQLPIFQPHNLDQVTFVTLAVVLALTIANSMVPKIALGGHPLKYLVFIPIMFFISGFDLIVIPKVAHMMM